MAKYIDAASFVGGKLTSSESQMRFREMTGQEAYFEFLRMVNDAPAAEVEPVRHGHWIDCEADEYFSYVRCSECGDEFTCWETDCVHTEFCPGCGADMRGADNA